MESSLTISVPTITAAWLNGFLYVTYAEACSIMASRLKTEAWDSASVTRRKIALFAATRSVDRLNFRGSRNSITQQLSFPRDGMSTIPNAIKEATCLVANALLDGADEDYDPQIISHRNGSSSIAYDRDYLPLHQIHGIASAEAWRLLYPYLHEPNSIRLNRVS